MNEKLLEELKRRFAARFGRAPECGAYAPGRVEVLGNHTDYNEGYVLSAAMDRGTFFLASSAPDSECRLVAADIPEEVSFPSFAPAPDHRAPWANYVKGVWFKLRERRPVREGFMGMFSGDVPLGAGLSSSAALEMSAGLALGGLMGLDLDPLELARIGQAAEHDFAGVRCGLLDQITSLHGRQGALVMTDFRHLTVRPVPLDAAACLVVCNTGVKHRLVESEYNERRARCEEAARCFAEWLPHPVRSLRDVSTGEWDRWAERLEPITARRAAHVIGENERVLRGAAFLESKRLREFGRLMFASHESSRLLFENSCAELDVLVEAAGKLPAVLGARLSGGGFGGGIVALTTEDAAADVQEQLVEAYRRAFGRSCEAMLVRASSGARRLFPKA